ncbi:aminopeptidase PepB [Kangiella sediminilitoris]|uniref:PepB aminopeptidase n=1 Tax=Kangiella sediminilitoris TaxID=1144748 RepID=A0A1B3BD71_9GAMM|nr:aminopeptidase PepB [Kangiella sediminilitoris]AOE50751.1 PepB aminopeptidase [Kangiella sediminilitoris]
MTLDIYLSSDSAPAQWGEGALLSFKEDSATIHTDDAEMVQVAARRLMAQGLSFFALKGDWSLEQQWAFFQGAYEPKVDVQIDFADLSEKDSAELDARIQVSRWMRSMVNETPEVLAPEVLAQEAAQFVQSLSPDHVSYEIVSGEDLEKQGHIGTWEVGRGSKRPPALLKLKFDPKGNGDKPAAALVGKGITFDSGGYSIKPSAGMLHMKADMGGAATVTGGLALAILRGLDKPVNLYLCCAENLISGHAYKLGDILTYPNGLTVEIHNTDAEGRVVLADGLLLAGESGADVIIDAATLTGAAVTALGNDYNGVFALDQEASTEYLSIATDEQEKHWPLPLEPFHAHRCPSQFADTANSKAVKGGGPGGASNAAGFLSRFVPNDGKGWLHIDLASAYNDSPTSKWAAGGTGLGFRTIAAKLLRS